MQPMVIDIRKSPRVIYLKENIYRAREREREGEERRGEERHINIITY